jgi:hypothetical protein
MNIQVCAYFSLATIVVAAPAWSEQRDFVVVNAHVNPKMQPKGPTDVLRECRTESLCRTLASTAATSLGVPPGQVSAVFLLVPKAERKGEEARFYLRLPQGYEYCKSSIKTLSVMPPTGKRASTMGATSTNDGVRIATWTPRQGLGKGRSLVDAKYTIYGVRNDLATQARAAGKCREPGKTLISCSGARGVNRNGLPACGAAED